MKLSITKGDTVVVITYLKARLVEVICYSIRIHHIDLFLQAYLDRSLSMAVCGATP